MHALARQLDVRSRETVTVVGDDEIGGVDRNGIDAGTAQYGKQRCRREKLAEADGKVHRARRQLVHDCKSAYDLFETLEVRRDRCTPLIEVNIVEELAAHRVVL